MTRAPSAAALAALLLLATSCTSARSPSSRGVIFASVPLSATAAQVDYSAGELPAYRSALPALCRSAELALEGGFRYLRVYDRERLGPRQARWKLQFFHTPPMDAILLDVTQPTWQGDPPADGVLDAVSFAATCGD